MHKSWAPVPESTCHIPGMRICLNERARRSTLFQNQSQDDVAESEEHEGESESESESESDCVSHASNMRRNLQYQGTGRVAQAQHALPWLLVLTSTLHHEVHHQTNARALQVQQPHLRRMKTRSAIRRAASTTMVVESVRRWRWLLLR